MFRSFEDNASEPVGYQARIEHRRLILKPFLFLANQWARSWSTLPERIIEFRFHFFQLQEDRFRFKNYPDIWELVVLLILMHSNSNF